MEVGLLQLDGNMPNYALMKISSFHKSIGDNVEFYNSIYSDSYDQVYVSKIFTYTPSNLIFPANTFFGGSGFDLNITLPDDIDQCEPDYKLYNIDYSIGYLTRGCNRKCPWCIVPQKEGRLKPYRDIEDIAKHDNVILFDNNILASDYGINQIEKITKMNIRVDFNQGLDARLIDDKTARLLSKVNWLKPLRMSCDTTDMIDVVLKSARLLRWHNCVPRRYFIYMLVQDQKTALECAKALKGANLDIFAQNYIDINGKKDNTLDPLCRYINRKEVFNSITWDEYKYKYR